MESGTCPGCERQLKEPFICCAECSSDREICLHCYAKGIEFGEHKNHHNYEIKSTSFSLLQTKWTAAEELKLLSVIAELGVGNWQEVAKKMHSKSTEECERHYLQCYISNPSPPLPKFEVNTEQCWRRPMPFKASVCPPRPDGLNQDDILYPAGYLPARGEFINEYDNFAECDLKDVEFDQGEEDEIFNELNMAVAEIYLSRLSRRHERNKIIRDYGLLDAGKENAMSYTYGKEEKFLRDSLRCFVRLHTPEEHEMLTQGMLHERFLQSRITHLQEYRSNGLKKLRDASLYERLKKRRKMFKPRKKILDEMLVYADNPASCQVWLHRQLNGNRSMPAMVNFPLINRKPCQPLDISNLPGVDRLDAGERDLCSSIRISPQQYNSYRSILVKESDRVNGLRLADARPLLKIDVNKTKRLYEFLLERKLLHGVDS